MTKRYAIYYAPAPESPLWRLGSDWIGRDAASGKECTHPETAGFRSPDIAAMTRGARRYGFHATLKPPFRLAEGSSEGMLLAAFEDFAYFAAAIAPIRLEVATLDGFLALRPAAGGEALRGFSSEIVERFDRFRAPAEPSELARRAAGGLTQRQSETLKRWGYPHLFADFRFHMTLTDRLDEVTRRRLMPALEAYFAPALAGVHCLDRIALFVEPEAGQPFQILDSFPLAPQQFADAR
ncbi:MAG: DUF1045 domain-containing protein [Hyphomicrobiales bacterium]